VRLAQSLVAFEFKRAKRRSIGFVIGPDGLVVSAPRWVPLSEVDAAVREKADWIVKKLGLARARQQQMEAQQIDWQNGCTVPFLGQPVTLVLDPTHGFKGVGALSADPLAGTDALRLQIGLPGNATPAQMRDAVQAWLMREARRIFTERLGLYAPQLGVSWSKLSLSSAGTRWGSASSSGAIRLNWRLVHMKMALIDYVVVHELSHLRVMDHSPRFWDTVATVMPDYATLRGQLKDGAVPSW
jgi:predicted metal-dependent hydrolase